MATKKKLLQAAAGAAGGAALNVEDVFSTYIYDGTGSTNQTITNGIDLSGEGGLVWAKARDFAYNNFLVDTERGGSSALRSDSTGAASTYTQFLSFNSDGYEITSSDSEHNNSSYNYASWSFRKAPKFFDCVTYTGDGTAGRTISHNLGTTVGCIIVKCTSATGRDWAVFHRSIDATSPEDYYIPLNYTDSRFDYAMWNDTAPTSTEFTVGSNNFVNGNGDTYVAYLFAHNDGDGEFGPNSDQDIIKCGSYTGNGSSTGPEINLGWEPQWLLFKDTTNSNDWIIIDNMRGMVVDNDLANADAYLRPNSANQEGASTFVEPTPTGFKVQNNGWTNVSGANIIYIAIRRGPMAVPTVGTDVFDPVTYSGDGSSDRLISSGTGVVDFAIFSERNAGSGSGYVHGVVDRMRGTKELRSSATSTEFSSSLFPNFDSNEGLFVNNVNIYNHASGSVVANMWKRAPNYFDVVAYKGNGTAGHTVSHNLGVAPEMMWVKNRTSTGEFAAYHSGLNGSVNPEQYGLYFTQAAEFRADFLWNDTAPTDSQFTVGNSSRVNSSSQSYIAYLFASLDGISKVGSYTGNGTNQTIDCGFSSGARFVLIRRYSSQANWIVFDSERGIVSGNDPALQLNLTTAELTSYDDIDPDSSGFIVGGTSLGINISNEEYIFYAIA